MLYASPSNATMRPAADRMPIRAPAPAAALAGNQALLRSSDPGRLPAMLRPSRTPLLHRKCACGGSASISGECTGCRDENESALRRKADGRAGPAVAPPIVHEVLRSSGTPLDRQARGLMEQRFGCDFSTVRLHTDARAATSARAVNASAYAVGRDVVFGASQYAPDKPEGLRLLAHELAHVVQAGNADMSQRSPLPLSHPRDPSEQAADSAADAVVRGGQPGIAAGIHVGVARSVAENAPAGQGESPLPATEGATALPAPTPATVPTGPSGAAPGPTPGGPITTGCIAPSFVVTPVVASAFGTVAELLIEPDYIAQKGGTPFGDVFLDNPLGPMSYIAFLAAHHPSLDVTLLSLQIGLSGGVLVPDILDTRSQELYEIKPDSPDGRVLGRGKLAAIDAFMSFNSLPYARGTSYTPTASIPIPLGAAALAPFLGLPILLACGIPDVTLKVTRAAPGLLLYEICITADFGCWLKVFTLELLIVLIILAILAAKRLPLPIPVPPVPVPVPAPVPVPV